MMKTKVLVLLLVLLFAIFVGEIIFYFYSNSSTKGDAKVYTGITPSVTQVDNKINTSTFFGNSVPALTATTRFYLNFITDRAKKNITTSSSFTNQYDGRIASIVDTSQEAPKGFVNKKIIILRSLTEDYTYKLYLTESQLSRLKTEGKNGETMNFSDLKKGDIVKITEHVNLLKDNYFSGIESFRIEVKNR